MAISFILLLIGVLLLIASCFGKSDPDPDVSYIPVKIRIPHNTGSGIVWYVLFILLVALLVMALNGV